MSISKPRAEPVALGTNTHDIEDKDEEPPPSYVTEFDDVHGWLSAYYDNSNLPAWRWSRPRLHYPASLQYKAGNEYFAVDGMGRKKKGTQRFECTIDPFTGKFERLCVQTRDSFCRLKNSTWDRTIIRSSPPRMLRLALFPTSGIHWSRRWKPSEWTAEDWFSVLWRYIPAGLGVSILVFLPNQGQPVGKNPHAYLPFRYNGSRYPRIARNPMEDRGGVYEQQPSDPSGLLTKPTIMYRAFRPRYLCYLTTETITNENGEEVKMSYFETRHVCKDDHTPYAFISYTKTQFDVEGDSEATDANYQKLWAWATSATRFSASGREAGRLGAFWIDNLCQPLSKFDEETEMERDVTDTDEVKGLVDHDVYVMSDIIRGAEKTVVIVQAPPGSTAQRPTLDADALTGWGERVWTLPEVILSRGTDVTLVRDSQRPQEIPKVRLAELAWRDAGASRQLVEHYTNLHLSRLELVSIAVKCLQERRLRLKYNGDRSYALMGLLRVRPKIDSDDSSFQAFARLSLPQDNDRLMERLICLLPNDPDEPWEKMSDRYNSGLWDIYPDTQVCGIGENDTIIVDGFRGALIQWSMFSTVQTMGRATLWRKIITIGTGLTPLLLILGAPLLASGNYDSGAPDTPYSTQGTSYSAQDTSTDPVVIAGAVLVAVSLAVLLAAPLYLPYFYSGKLYEAEPCLFGVEGYVPLPAVEELLFGFRLGRLKWSPYGSPLSRHRPRGAYFERTSEEATENGPLLHGANGTTAENFVCTYPVEAVDPCSSCANCSGGEAPTRCNHETFSSSEAVDPCSSCVNSSVEEAPTRCNHETFSSSEAKTRRDYGEMKIFTLIDTFSMTATLFEARRPPVALMIGGSEGGMKHALACSYDVTTGTMYKETVLRVPSQTVDKMHSLQRVRLGLKNPLKHSDVVPVGG